MSGNSVLDRYTPEEFTKDEATILLYFFSNINRPVFVPMNMRQATAGALFARYSRTHKSLRRLFLDEFISVPDNTTRDNYIAYLASGIRAGRYAGLELGAEKSAKLYDAIVTEFGDDSVNQLGAAHVAIEGCSNIETKVLEWGRLSAYLEQSTRFIKFDEKRDGRYPYMVPPEVQAVSWLDREFRAETDAIFDIYSDATLRFQEFYTAKFPYEDEAKKYAEKNPGKTLSRAAYLTSIRTQACDKSRALLPASTVSNLGWFGSGQQFEMAINRMRAHPLQEARDYAELILAELRTVIPEFLKRCDEPNKGLAFTEYLREREEQLRILSNDADDINLPPVKDGGRVVLIDYTEIERAEAKIIASALYRNSHLPMSQLMELAYGMKPEEKLRILKAAAGTRQNRRHKPGREFEDISVEFDILGDYGSFRDLQRHRILTIDWQELTPHHNYEVDPAWNESGLEELLRDGMLRSRNLYGKVHRELNETVAQYAVAFGYPLRYRMRFNLREAFHMFELRTTPQAHPVYKSIILEMVEKLVQVAGYDRLMALLTFIGKPQEEFLSRVDALAATEAKLEKLH